MVDKYQLAQVFSPSARTSWELRQGQVSSIQADYTATVTIAGSSAAVSGVHYIGQPPRPNSGVWMMSNGTDLLIIGSMAAASGALAPRVYRTTNQSIPNATATAIAWDAEDYDTYGLYSSGDALNITIPGRYIAMAQADFAANATGVRTATITLNGVTTIGGISTPAHAATARLNISSLPFTVTTTTAVRVLVEQNSGGALDVVASGSVSPGLGIFYLGA